VPPFKVFLKKEKVPAQSLGKMSGARFLFSPPRFFFLFGDSIRNPKMEGGQLGAHPPKKEKKTPNVQEALAFPASRLSR
jgi:hypothetical protein